MIVQHIVRLPIGVAISLYTDTDRAVALLRAKRKLLADPSPLLNRVADIMRVDIREQFKAGGNPPWKPLRPNTLAAKAMATLPSRTPKGHIPWRLTQNRAFGPGNILIATGRARDAWGRKDSPDHDERIDVRDGSVRMGPKRTAELAYIAVHQHGSRPYTIRPRRRLALRFITTAGVTFAGGVQHPGLPARPVRITESAVRQIVALSESWFKGEGFNGVIDVSSG